MFDTLKFARALRDGGQFTPEQAERLSDALSDAIAGEVVSRADLGGTESEIGRKIEEVRAEVAGVETRLERKIEEVRAEVAAMEARLERKIDQARAELQTDIRGMEVRIEAAKADTIKWVVGIISFQTVAIIGAAIVLARILAR